MIDFNVKDYARSVLPAGRYTFNVLNAELKPTKSNPDCNYLSVSLEVVSDFRKGTRIFDNFNIYHEKETVRNIGRSQLAELCNAIGLPEMKNISELLSCVVDAQVSVDFYNGNETNRVDKYFQTVGEKISDFQMPEPKVDERFDDEIPF